MTSGKKRAAQLNREIAEVLGRGRGMATRGPLASAVPEGSPETQQGVLRDLNQRYNLAFDEPWRMLAYLRRAADQLATAGRRDSDLFRRLVSDHGRLRRAIEVF